MSEPDINAFFVPTYTRSGPLMAYGTGIYLFDTKGNRFLDFGSGIAVNALGHSHPRLLKVIEEQGKKLLHVSNLYHTEPPIQLAQSLIEKSFGDRVFFCNSGTEAVEAGIKFSRKWARKQSADAYHVLSFTDGFHGRTYGALSATAQKKFHEGFEPIVEGFHYAPFNDIIAAKEILRSFSFAAIIVEPLQGEGGINRATTEFLQFLRDYSSKRGTALIFDEIQCGMGRTGTLWHYEQYGIRPDIMAIAKPLGGGLPLGAVVCIDPIASTLTPGDHGTTFGGNPLACALGNEVIHIVSENSFLQRVRENGAYLKSALEKVASKTESISTVVGTGLILGVRMKNDVAPIIGKCKEHGLLVIKGGHNTIRFMPPLIVDRNEIDEAVDIFDRVLN